MRRIRVPERTATQEELAEDRRRCLEAKQHHRPESQEFNVTRTLVVLAAWKPCSCCRDLVLFVNEQARTDGDFLCGSCERRRETFRAQCLATPPKKPARPALLAGAGYWLGALVPRRAAVQP